MTFIRVFPLPGRFGETVEPSEIFGIPIPLGEAARFRTRPTDPTDLVGGFGRAGSTPRASFAHVEIGAAVTEAVLGAVGGPDAGSGEDVQPFGGRRLRRVRCSLPRGRSVSASH